MEEKLFEGMGTIITDWIGLMQMAAEFLSAAPTLDADGLDSGMKCFRIAWMNCKFADDFMGRRAKDAEHPELLRIMQLAYMDQRIKFVVG